MLYYLASICLSYLFAAYVTSYFCENYNSMVSRYIRGLIGVHYMCMYIHIILLYVIVRNLDVLSACPESNIICGIFKFVYFCVYIFIVLYNAHIYNHIYNNNDIIINTKINYMLLAAMILLLVIFINISDYGEYIVILFHIPYFMINLLFYNFIKKHKDDSQTEPLV